MTRPQTPVRSRLATIALIVATLAGTAAAAPATAATSTSPATAGAALAVQVSGTFEDVSPATGAAAGIPARSGHTSIVVGTIATATTGTGQQTSEADVFRYTVACGTPTGDGCGAGTQVAWNFGDGTTATTTVGTANAGDPDAESPLAYTHSYTKPGAYTVTVTIDDTQTPAYGTGAIRALVGPRYADVDAAYATTDTSGTTTAGKSVDPVSESVWAVSALGLMGACQPDYSTTSTQKVTGERATDPGRATFCPRPGNDPTTKAAAGKSFATTNPAPRADYTNDQWSGTGAYTDTAGCLSDAANCGLPVDVFVSHGAPAGSPLASCQSLGCRQALTNRGALTRPNGPQMVYDPTNCADNTTAVRNSDGTTSLTRGLEPGCESRGEFLQALLAAVEGTNVTNLAAVSGAIDPTACPSGSLSPAADGSDGIRRTTALLSVAGVTISPCDPDAALTKGEAYRMLAAVVRATNTTGLSLPDLEDRNLGTGTVQPYPYRDAIYGLLADGAPLVGSVTCPVASAGPVCFNPYQALTRSQTARLLAYFVLGATSDVAATQVELTADTSQVALGSTVQLHLRVTVPTWLQPYDAHWTFSVGNGAAPDAATFDCPVSNSATITTGQLTLTCPVTITREPVDGNLPLQVTVNGTTYPPVVIAVTNTAPVANSVALPTLAEDAAATPATVTFSDHENNPISSVQVATSAAGPWSSSVDTRVLTATVGAIDNTNDQATVNLTPAPSQNGTYTFYVRVCDIGPACSAPLSATGTVTPVNDPPIAYPISNVLRNDNVAAATGDCRTVQTLAPTGNLVQLRGADPIDDGQSGYTSTITGYQVTAPANPVGTMYTCAGNGTWTAVAAGTTAQTTYPLVLFNPTPGQYATGAYSYTVIDGGTAPGGLASTPQPITVINTHPGVAPVAALTSDPTTAPATTGEFTFSAAGSTDDGNPNAIASYAFDFGDGQHTTTPASSVTHRYSTAGTYTVTVTVTDSEGLTDTTSVTVTVTVNDLDNPTLDTDTASWSAGDGSTLTWTNSQPHGGAGAGEVDLTAIPDTGAVGPATCTAATTPTALRGSTVAGTTYQAVAWIRPTEATSGQPFTASISETDSSGTIGSSPQATVTLGAAGTWQKVLVSYTATQDKSDLTLTLSSQTSTTGTCFAFDDASLAPAS